MNPADAPPPNRDAQDEPKAPADGVAPAAEDADDWQGIDFTDPNSRLAPYYFQASHVVAAILLLLALFVYSTLKLVHSDLWGHMKFGEYIVAHRALPPHEMFSPYSDPGQPYVGYMWLAQVALYGVYEAGAALGGPSGGGEMLRTFHALLTCLKLLLLLLAYRRACGSLPLAIVGIALVLVQNFLPFSVQRPQVFGELFFAWTLFLLSGPLTWRAVILLPLVMAAWANFHGSYVIGIGLMGVFGLGRLLEGGWRDGWLWRLALALGLTPLAIGLTHPSGFGILWATLQFASLPNVRTVDEWQPLDFHRAAGGHWGYLAIVVVLALSQALSRRTLSPTRVLLVCVFGVAPLFQERLMSWWVLLVPWIVLPLWQDLGAWMPARFHVQTTPSFRKTLFCLALLVIALIWTGAGQLVIGNPTEPLKDMVTPVTPVNFMKHQIEGDPFWEKALADYPDRKFTGTVFTPDNLGDYPIWMQARRAPVLVYSHVQFFRTAHWDDFMTMLKARPGWEELFERYRVNMAWIEPDKQVELAEALRQNDKEWAVLVDDTRPGEGSPRALFKRFVALRRKPL